MAIEILEMHTVKGRSGVEYTYDIRCDSRSKYKYEICISIPNGTCYSCGGYNDLGFAKRFVTDRVGSRYADNLWNYISGRVKL